MESNDFIKIATAVASVGAVLVSVASIISNVRNNCNMNNPYQPISYGNPYGNPYTNCCGCQTPVTNVQNTNPQQNYYNQPVMNQGTPVSYYGRSNNIDLMWNNDPTNSSRRNYVNPVYPNQNINGYPYGYNDLANPNMYTSQYHIPFNTIPQPFMVYPQYSNSYNYIPQQLPYWNTSFGYEKYHMTDPQGVQRHYCSKEMYNVNYNDLVWEAPSHSNESCEHVWNESSHPFISITHNDKPPDSSNGVVPLFGNPDWFNPDICNAV